MINNQKMIIGTFQLNDFYTLKHVVKASLDSECYAFDLSPSYGNEKLFGEIINIYLSEGKIDRKQLFIQSKIDGIHMFYQYKHSIEKVILEQCRLLNLKYFDSILVHWPLKKYFVSVWRELCFLKSKGVIRQIGVCNLDKRGYQSLFIDNNLESPDIIQNEISPLNTDKINTNYFKGLGCIVQAYSPLCRMNSLLKTDDGLLSLSRKYDVDIGRIILKWHIQNGIVPIFSSKKSERITNNLKMDFQLNNAEISYIDKLNANYKLFPVSYGCPGY